MLDVSLVRAFIAVNITGLAVGAASTVGVAENASVLVWLLVGIMQPGLQVPDHVALLLRVSIVP